MRKDQGNKAGIGADARLTRRTARKAVPSNDQENQENDSKKINMKGQKRSISENNISTRKRTAFGDLTNAIQSHADRISLARKKSVVTNNTKCENQKPPKPAQRIKRNSNRLKTSKSSSSLPVFTICVEDAQKEMTIAEQCDDILAASSSSSSDSAKSEDEIEVAKNDNILPEGVIPFDLDDDPNVVSEYAASIFRNMKIREEKYPVADYLSREGTLTTGVMRAILVDWLVEVQENFELYHETLYFAVKLVDFYLQNNNTPKEQLQLVGATALLIACKIEERQPPPLDDFQFICDDAYSNKQFIQMEIKIFKALNFDINMPISYRFLRRFSRVTSLKMEILTLARYILELSLHAASFVHEPPSKMAASCLCLAMKMKNVGKWDVNHSYHTGYEEKELLELMKLLNQMLVDAPDSKLQTVRTKYSHPIHFQVAKTKPVESSELSLL